MKQLIATIAFSLFCLSSFAQKSAEDGSIEFVTKKDDGNSKFIKYTAFNFGYAPLNYTINDYKVYALKNQVYTFGVEFYNTFSRKVSGSEHFNVGGFNQNFFVGIDYALYFLLVKGLYIKPRVGYNTMYDDVTGLSPDMLTYGGDIGYLFRVSSPSARKPILLSVFGGYTAMTGNASGYDYNYDYLEYSYKLSGYSFGVKLMFGPKGSGGTTTETNHNTDLK